MRAGNQRVTCDKTLVGAGEDMTGLGRDGRRERRRDGRRERRRDGRRRERQCILAGI